jgi:uncharacterized protein (UPF0332 family)
MNPRKLLDVANELLEGIDEEHWRSAVSRAYYAAFHVASELLVRCGFVVPQAEKAHAHLWMRLSNSGHPDIVQAGRWLNMLRTARNQAEYVMAIDFPFTRAHEEVSRALDVVRLLDEARDHEPAREQITQVMRDYERDVLRDVTWQPPAGS